MCITEARASNRSFGRTAIYLEWIEARSGTLVDLALVKRLFLTTDSYRKYVHAYVAGQAKMPQGLLDYLNGLEKPENTAEDRLFLGGQCLPRQEKADLQYALPY